MKLEVLVIDQSFEGKNVILIEGDSQHLNYFIKSLALIFWSKRVFFVG